MTSVLVVDDEFVVLDALAMLLEGEGYRVRKASNGEEAWSRLQEDAPDFVVSDVQMPILDGVALARRISAEERFSSVRVILMVEAVGPRPAPLEATWVLVVKPVLFDQLLAILRTPRT